MPFPEQNWNEDFEAHQTWVSQCDPGYYILKIPNDQARTFVRDHGLDLPNCNSYDENVIALRGPYRSEDLNFDATQGNDPQPEEADSKDKNPFKYHREWISVIGGYYVINISSDSVRESLKESGINPSGLNSLVASTLLGPFDDDPIDEGDDRGGLPEA